MAIAKGEQWGEAGSLPPGAPVAASDAEAAALVAGAHRAIGLSTGDLARTLGVTETNTAAVSNHLVPVDAIQVTLDDARAFTAVAHVTIGNLRLHRRSAAIMNAAFIGARNIAPRAHPGDGRADVVRLDLTIGDRVKAWRRMLTGTHVPHPGITIRSRSEGTVDMGVRRAVCVDGRRVGRSVSVHFRIVPEAITIAV